MAINPRGGRITLDPDRPLRDGPRRPSRWTYRRRRLVIFLAVAAFITGAVFGVRSVLEASKEDKRLKEMIADTREIGGEPPGPHMVLTDPSMLAGQEITIVLVVSDIVDPNSFRGAAAEGGDDSVLVVYPGVPVVRLGQRLRFTGGVRECTKEAADAYLKTDMAEGTFEITDDRYCVITAAIENAEEGEF